MERGNRWADVLVLVVAVVVPLAGVVLAVAAYGRGERALALRLAAAVVLGAFLYALLFA
jgi:zinc transporter ZupT